MNIVHIYPSVIRMHGATKWLMLFASKLQEKGHSNTIVCARFKIPIPHWFKGEIKTLFRNNNGQGDFIGSKEYKGVKKLLFIAFDLLSVFLLPFIIPRKTDVIVFIAEISLVALILAKVFFKKRKFVYYCYQPPRELYDLSDISKRTFGIWFIIFTPIFYIYKILDKVLVKKMDMVLIFSNQYQNYVRKIYGDIDYKIIPAGVDFSLFNTTQLEQVKIEQVKQKLNLHDKNVLLMVSVLTPKKNILLFIKLIKNLVESGYLIHGLVIGEGPEEGKLKKFIIENDLETHVTLLGYVTQEELPYYYNIHDILYYLEPNGAWTMSIIEAGAVQKPVIVAPGGAMPTLVNHQETGFILSDMENVNELYKYTTFLLNNIDTKNEMGKNNYNHIKQFSADNIAGEFLGFIKDF